MTQLSQAPLTALFLVVSKTKHSKTKTEARSTQISKTKHPKLENEAPTNSKTKTPRAKTKHLKLGNVVKRGVRVIRASLTLGFQPRFRRFVLLLTRTWIRQNLLTDSVEVYISMYVYRKNAYYDKMYQQ